MLGAGILYCLTDGMCDTGSRLIYVSGLLWNGCIGQAQAPDVHVWVDPACAIIQL